MSDEQHVSPFEQIRHETEEGGEYWSARELSKVLGYLNWRNFEPVIEKAETACASSGHAVSDHFAHTRTLIETGKGAHREVDDVQLSRYACYLVVQNADPSKEIVALGQTYFAVQTRRAELGDELAGLSEAQRRLYIRGQVADHNKRLADAAQDVGVVTSRDFAIFQDHGYMGLYNGERARDIHARKGLKKGQQILDWMDSEELAANLFRATQTEAKLRREEIVGKDAANQTHFAVGREVRETIKRLGGTMPEELPTPSESIQQLRKREEQAIEARRQPQLFPPAQSE
jgi:DNA-damage-inducible protein D